MAYVSGTANSVADLLTAIRNACTANGWTLSGNVLHKGACFVEVMVDDTGSYISVQAGTGIDGANNLTGRADTPAAAIGVTLFVYIGSADIPFAYPVAYEVFIHADPDEVYVHTSFAVDAHQQMGWGAAQQPGLAGSGNWYAGCRPERGGYGMGGMQPGGQTDDASYQGVSLFGGTLNYSCGVHHALDGPTWLVRGSVADAMNILMRQPNQWNGEAILVPIRVYADRPSGFISPVLECAHARFVNIANLTDGQIITLGGDRWKVYPFARRGSSFTSTDVDNTWFAGHAFRYDGP